MCSINSGDLCYLKKNWGVSSTLNALNMIGETKSAIPFFRKVHYITVVVEMVVKVIKHPQSRKLSLQCL